MNKDERGYRHKQAQNNALKRRQGVAKRHKITSESFEPIPTKLILG